MNSSTYTINEKYILSNNLDMPLNTFTKPRKTNINIIHRIKLINEKIQIFINSEHYILLKENIEHEKHAAKKFNCRESLQYYLILEAFNDIYVYMEYVEKSLNTYNNILLCCRILQYYNRTITNLNCPNNSIKNFVNHFSSLFIEQFNILLNFVHDVCFNSQKFKAPKIMPVIE